jgi:hypothetical protein
MTSTPILVMRTIDSIQLLMGPLAELDCDLAAIPEVIGRDHRMSR